jgi:hypothetical protein
MATNGKRAGRLPEENAAAMGYRGGNSGLLNIADWSSPLVARTSASDKPRENARSGENTSGTGAAAAFLRDLMELGRYRYGGPSFIFPDTEEGRTHALIALRYAIRVDHSFTLVARAVSWAALWSPWMLIHTPGRWQEADLKSAISAALQVPPSFNSAADSASVGITYEEWKAIRPRRLTPGVQQ